ncbi:hypothetical protein CYJ18_13405, partial [Actinomyces naeslundii]
ASSGGCWGAGRCGGCVPGCGGRCGSCGGGAGAGGCGSGCGCEGCGARGAGVVLQPEGGVV